MRLVLFDFCETLVDFQTADAFVDFVRRKRPSLKARVLEWIFRLTGRLYGWAILHKIRPHYPFSKKCKLLQLKGMHRSELEQLAAAYYEERLVPAQIPMLHQKMVQHLQDGDTVWIVSGGYDIYLKLFAQKWNLAGVIASRIGFNQKGICTGTMLGEDCLREAKVQYLNQQFTNIQELRPGSISYSDSITDLPLLKWTETGVVVSHRKSQSWASSNHLQELIWNETIV